MCLAFIYAALSVGASSCDVFGLDSASEAANEIAFQAFMAPFDNVFQEGVSDEIKVMLLDQELYEKHGWPLSYGLYRNLLETLQAQQPKAIFLDLIFTPARDGLSIRNGEGFKAKYGTNLDNSDSEFCEMAAYLYETSYGNQTPNSWLDGVLFKLSDKKDGLPRKRLKTHQDCLLRARKSVVGNAWEELQLHSKPAGFRGLEAWHYLEGFEGVKGRAPVLIGADLSYFEQPLPGRVDPEDVPAGLPSKKWAKQAVLDQVALLVTTSVGGDNDLSYRLRVDQENLPSPALVLARGVACHSAGEIRSAAGCKRATTSDGNPGPASLQAKMDAAWGRLPDTMRLSWGILSAPDSAKSAGCKSYRDRFDVVTDQLLFGYARATSLGGYGAKSPCPVHSTVSALPYFTLLTGGADDLHLEREDEFAKDRLLLVGVDIAPVDDTLVSPIHGVVPAVHGHAMAMDNLLSADVPYRDRSEDRWLPYWDALLTFCILFVAFGFLMWVRDGSRAFARLKSRPSLWGGVVVTLAVGLYASLWLCRLIPNQQSFSNLWLHWPDVAAFVLSAIAVALGILTLVRAFICRADWPQTAAELGGSGWEAPVRFNPMLGVAHLGPHLLVLILVTLAALVVAFVFARWLHTPPINIIGCYLYVVGFYLVIFEEERKTILSAFSIREISL